MGGSSSRGLDYDERVKVIGVIGQVILQEGTPDYVRESLQKALVRFHLPHVPVKDDKLCAFINSIDPSQHPAGLKKLHQLFWHKVPLTFDSPELFEEFRRDCRRAFDQANHTGDNEFYVFQIGSATTGYKMNPKKEFRFWQPPPHGSDADFAVIHMGSYKQIKAEERKKLEEYGRQQVIADSTPGYSPPDYRFLTYETTNHHYKIILKKKFQETSVGRALNQVAKMWSERLGTNMAFKLNTPAGNASTADLLRARFEGTGPIRIC